MKTPQVPGTMQRPTITGIYRTFPTERDAEEVAAELRRSNALHDPEDMWTYQPEPDGDRWAVVIREPDGYVVGKW